MQNYTVVIRSAGERTKQACLEIVHEQAAEECVHLIEEAPFEAALKKCYQIGMESDRQWLVAIDADVLLQTGIIRSLLSIGERLPKNICHFQGVVYDKILGRHRKAGVRIYRTYCLAEAINAIPPEGETLRPEAHVIRSLENKGHMTKSLNLVTGIHDYEQFFTDIYRKAFLHANKHQDKVIENLQRWKHQASSDNDFKIIIRGVIDGLTHSERAKPDTRLYGDLSQRAMANLGMQEKSSFDARQAALLVGQVLEEAGPYVPNSRIMRIKQIKKDRGLLRLALWAGGSAIEKTGKWIKNL